MSTIVTIAAGDQITNSRADLNTNFSNLNTDKIETSTLDTDTALTANSDAKIATQKAIKAYVDARTAGSVLIASAAFTKDISSTTLTTIAHGLGAAPEIVRLTGMLVFVSGAQMIHSHAYSTYVSGVQSSVSMVVLDDDHSLTATFKLAEDLSNYTTAAITVDATNIYIAWTKTSGPTGTAYLVWEAQR